MFIPTIIIGTIALVLVFIGYFRGSGEHITGLKIGGNLLMQVLPLMVLALIVAGMVQALIPREIVSRWLGAESGFRGIMIGTLMGSLTPSGPFVSMPIAAGFLRVGASVGTLVAFMTAWSILAVHRLPMEVGIMGWKFALIRLATTFFFPPIAGLIADRLFSHIKLV